MFCHRCGNQVSPGSQFCNHCGNKLQAENPARRSRSIPTPMARPARRRMAVDDQFPEEPFIEEYDENEEEDLTDEFVHAETDSDEDIIFTIYPAFYEVANQYAMAVLLSIAATALIAYLNLPLWIAVVFAAVCFLKPIYHHIQNNHTVYRLTTTKIEIKSGLFSVTSRNIPLRHIQDVSVSETFKERLIGIGDVVIDSAAIEGKILMRNIKNPRKYTDMILNQL
ncbi:MAG: PH domain-containing protein [Acidobacteriota bacterium]